jgi:type IV pilus modification protein PilV
MRPGGLRRIQPKEAGFSMVELLITALVMAIGLLGLAMLQTMSLRAAGGSGNLSTAVQLADQMMDRVELEGRLTYSNESVGTEYTTATALTGLQYYDKAKVEKYYNIDPASGNAVEVAAPASGEASPLFYLKMTQTVATGIGVSDVTVLVQFTDGINKTTGLPVTRTTTLTRRILHG